MENESTFVAPEGVYSVTDEHKPNNQQNLAVHIGTPLYASKVSSIVLRFPPPKQGGAPGFAQLLGGGKSEPKKEKPEKVAKERDDGVSLSSSDTPEETDPPPPSAQEHNTANPSTTQEHHTLFSHPPAVGKKKNIARPKHNIRTTSSTFITRMQTAEGMTKNLQTKQGDVTFLFYNMAKSFVWIEAGSKVKVFQFLYSCIRVNNFSKEPLSRVTFGAHPTCHDINASTASPERLDIIIGFNTGDLIWLGVARIIYFDTPVVLTFTFQDPISSRYGRLNKQVR